MNTAQILTTKPYNHRQATPEDAKAIAPLMAAFAAERESADPSMTIKPNYNFEEYVAHQLDKPNSFCLVLEYIDTNATATKTIVGIFFAYTYDEAPPPNLPAYLQQEQEQNNPFIPRRVGSVLGLYVQPNHRQPQNIKQLIEAGIEHAETLKVTDIDVLVSAEQTGIHTLLERLGFVKAAVQYTRHYDIPADTKLPSLHPPHPELSEVQLPEPSAIPLRDPTTNQLIRNAAGEPAFLMPLRDQNGQLILTNSKMPIYPTPLRDPLKNQWVFDAKGNLVVCPPVWDENNQILEHQGIPQFHPPAYKLANGEIQLQQDTEGNYIFCDVERDKTGKILRTPDGMPIFMSFSQVN
jgi:ribosomal protein S18 acetylase RimI-like enzyme